MLVKIQYANLINIAAKEEIIPELLQSKCNPENIYKVVSEFLDTPSKLKKQVEALTQSAKLSEEAAGTGKEPGSPSYDERLPNEEDQDRSPINSKRLKIAEDEEPLEFEIEEEVEPVDALVGLDAEDDDFL